MIVKRTLSKERCHKNTVTSTLSQECCHENFFYGMFSILACSHRALRNRRHS